MNALMAFTADTDPAVRHLFFGEPFLKVLSTVYRPGDEVVLRQWLLPVAAFALASGATRVGDRFTFAGHGEWFSIKAPDGGRKFR